MPAKGSRASKRGRQNDPEPSRKVKRKVRHVSGGRGKGSKLLDIPLPVKTQKAPRKVKRSYGEAVIDDGKRMKLAPAPLSNANLYDAMRMMDRIFPNVSQAINSGDKEEVIKTITTAKGRVGGIEWEEVGALFAATAGVMSRINQSTHNNEEIRKVCRNAAKSMYDYKEGKNRSFDEVFGHFNALAELLKNKNVVLSTMQQSEMESAVSAVNRDTAEQVLNERRANEERLALEEEIKMNKAQAEKAREDAEASLKIFKEQEMIKKLPETVENVEQQRKRAREAEVRQELASREYQESKAKSEMHTRMATINEVVKRKLEKDISDGSFGANKRAVTETALEAVGEIFRRSQESAEGSNKKVTSELAEVINQIPSFLEAGEEDIKAEAQAQGSVEDYLAQTAALESQIVSGEQEMVSISDRMEDLQEEAAAYDKLAHDMVQKRIDGNASASGAMYRAKAKECRSAKDAAKKILDEKRKAIEHNKAEVAARKEKVNSFHHKRELLEKLKSEYPLITDLNKQSKDVFDQENQSNLVQVETVAFGLRENKDINYVGNSIIENKPIIVEEDKEVVEGNLIPIIDKQANEIIKKEQKIQEDFDVKMEDAERRVDSEQTKTWVEDDRIYRLTRTKIISRDEAIRRQEAAIKWRNEQMAKLNNEKYLASLKSGALLAPTAFNFSNSDQLARVIGSSAQTPVAVPASNPSDLKSFSSVNASMISAINANGGDFGKLNVKGASSKKETHRNELKGGFLVGGRPDPLIDLQFWKNLYNKRK